MKKLLCILMTLVLCLPMALSVSAAIPTVDEADKVDMVVLMKHDFDDWTDDSINRNAGSVAALKAANGFVALNNLECSIVDGAFKMDWTNKSDAMFDLRLLQINSASKVKIAQDAVLSMKVMPLNANFSVGHLLDWGKDGYVENADATRTSIDKCQLKIGGKNVGSALPVNEYSLIEWVFHYDTDANKFATVDLLLNGEKLGTIVPEKSVDALEFLRIMRWGKASVLLDDITLALGSTSILYANSIEETTDLDAFAPEIGESPIPVIPEDDKIGMRIVNVIDFEDATTPNRDQSSDAFEKSHGYVVLDDLDCKIENGELVATDLNGGYLDLQLFQLDDFPKLNEDVVLSMYLKPLSIDFSTNNLMTFRFNTGDGFVSNKVSITGCTLKVGKQEVGSLPYGVSSLVEFVFHFNPDIGNKGKYDRVDVLLNAGKVGSFTLTCEGVESVFRADHFRMLQDVTGQYAIDNIIFACGDTSLAYYSPDKPIPEKPEDTTNNDNNNNNNNNNNNTNNNNNQVTTEAPTTDAPAPGTTEAPTTDAPVTEESNKFITLFGCSSVVASAGIGLMVCVIGAALLKKKEEIQ